MFVMLVGCLVVAGTRTATAQALCPENDVQAFDAGFLRAPKPITVEADLRGLGDMLPGGTWRMPASGGIASDGLALEGVSLTRNMETEIGSNVHTFDVLVDLRASENLVADLELVVVDGERSLRLGAFTDVAIRCQALSVSRKFSISDDDFVSFFAAGRSPTLRVKRTTRGDGC
jgi:hypothetical protein